MLEVGGGDGGRVGDLEAKLVGYRLSSSKELEWDAVDAVQARISSTVVSKGTERLAGVEMMSGRLLC